MFRIGRYYRGDRDVKPEPYGNAGEVQASIFKNAERMGIDPASIEIYIPIWERSGTTINDYSKNSAHFTATGGVINNEGYSKNLLTTAAYLRTVKTFPNSGPLSLIFNLEFTDAYNASFWEMSGAYFIGLNFGDSAISFFKDWSGGDVGGTLNYDIKTAGRKQFSLTWNNTNDETDDLKFFINGVKQTLTTRTLNGSELVANGYYQIGINSTSSSAFSLFQFLSVRGVLSDSQIAYLSDNPYYLLQRVSPVFYSVPLSLNLTQYAFRFRNDDGSEAAATWKTTADNENITLTPGSKTRIRIGIDATGDPASTQFQLEYRHKPSGGSFGAWGAVT